MLARADVWSGFALALLGLGLFWLSQDIRVTEVGLIGPRFVPQVVSVLMVLGGLTLALSRGQGPSNEASPTSNPVPWRAACLIVIGLMHVFLTPLIGYLATSALVAATGLALFGVRDWRVLLAGTLALPLIVHMVFIELMGVFMPQGRWFDLLALLP